MNRKKLFFVLLFLIGSVVFLSLTESVAAQATQYQLLEQIPGTPSQVLNLPDYLKALYNFAFLAVGIAALFMLSVGGFLYVTSAGNTSRLGTAKDIIRDSLIGLALALVAWLFLYIINPDLVTLKLPAVTPNSSATPLPTPPLTPPPATPPGTIPDLVRQVQTNGNIAISGSGSCKRNATDQVSPAFNLQEAAAKNGQMTACFNGCTTSPLFCSGSANLNPALLRALLQVASTYRITITSIAGGSHANGSGHYSGNAIDVQPSSTSYGVLMQAFRDAGVPAQCDNGKFVPCSDPSVTHVHIGS